MKSSFFFALALTSVALPIAAQDSTRVLRRRTPAEDLQLFSQVLNQIRVNHPDSIDTHDLFMAAIEAMVRAADPHSYVIPAARLAPEKEKALREGKLHPVPLAFSFIGGTPVVISIAPGTRAARLDIVPGDELIAIDGRPVAAESEIELEVTLAGQEGTGVELTLLRLRADGSLAELKRRVQREKADPSKAIPAVFMLDSITGYVRVTTFMGEQIAGELADALERLERAGMRQLMLDLRDNGGGSVDEAARVAGAFLPSGTLVYQTVGRKADVASTGKVSRVFWRSEKRYPTIVLINAGTASASEIVAGALQDHDRALIVGRPSFGKALIMQTLPLSDGSLMALVIGHLKTPCGRIIQRQYRDVKVRDYYRLARADRELAGRPTCQTANGRTVYGGGGIYPDVLLPVEDPVPVWLARAIELDLPLRWLGAALEQHQASFTTAEALARQPTLPASLIAHFVAFARAEGVNLPTDPESTRQLEAALLTRIAMAKWGEAGAHRVTAAFDPQIAAARLQFQQAPRPR